MIPTACRRPIGSSRQARRRVSAARRGRAGWPLRARAFLPSHRSPGAGAGWVSASWRQEAGSGDICATLSYNGDVSTFARALLAWLPSGVCAMLALLMLQRASGPDFLAAASYFAAALTMASAPRGSIRLRPVRRVGSSSVGTRSTTRQRSSGVRQMVGSGLGCFRGTAASVCWQSARVCPSRSI